MREDAEIVLIVDLFFSQKTSLTEDVGRSEMICMLTVPSSMTSRDLLDNVAPYSEFIESMKIIKESSPSKYMVLIKFKTQVSERCVFHTNFDCGVTLFKTQSACLLTDDMSSLSWLSETRG